MTRDVVSVSDTTDLTEIANLLETKRIKRVPVVRDASPLLIHTKPQPRKLGDGRRAGGSLDDGFPDTLMNPCERQSSRA
jgi:CBS domain-containing protein